MPEQNPLHTKDDMPFDHSERSVTHQPLELSKTPADRVWHEDRTHQDVPADPQIADLTGLDEVNAAFAEDSFGGD